MLSVCHFFCNFPFFLIHRYVVHFSQLRCIYYSFYALSLSWLCVLIGAVVKHIEIAVALHQAVVHSPRRTVGIFCVRTSHYDFVGRELLSFLSIVCVRDTAGNINVGVGRTLKS